MAINFEAANMAGYNNPKIEVFEAVVDLGTNTVTSAPSKTEIIRCLRRGSIPAIMQTTPGGSGGHLLWISAWEALDEGDTVTFGTSGVVISYPPDSESPIAGTGG